MIKHLKISKEFLAILFESYQLAVGRFCFSLFVEEKCILLLEKWAKKPLIECGDQIARRESVFFRRKRGQRSHYSNVVIRELGGKVYSSAG